MQGILSAGLLVLAFAAVAGLALLVVVRLFRISRPGQPSVAQPSVAQPSVAHPAGRAGERRDA